MAALAFLALLIALIPHAMQYGPQASLIAESFPTSLRYAGAGLGYQLASVIAGGPAPLVATFLLEKTGSVYSIAWAVLGLCRGLDHRGAADGRPESERHQRRCDVRPGEGAGGLTNLGSVLRARTVSTVG